MVSTSMMAKAFNVVLEERSGLFFGTSPDIKGLFIAKNSPEEVLAAIPSTVEDLFAACGQSVVVGRLEEGDLEEPSWVAMPADIARRSLERAATRAS